MAKAKRKRNPFFEQLMQSVQEMDEVVKGERSPSREFNVDAVSIKQLHARSGLSQAKCAPWRDGYSGTLAASDRSRRAGANVTERIRRSCPGALA